MSKHFAATRSLRLIKSMEWLGESDIGSTREAVVMDPPPDLNPEQHRRLLDEAFKNLVATTSPPPLPLPKSSNVNFVKQAAAPRIQITSTASRLKSPSFE